jgi:hypothetical protein
MRFSRQLFFSSILLFFTQVTLAAEILTNAAHMADAPTWVTPGRINRIVDHIQNILEWDIHRVEVYWYKDQASFEKMHGLGGLPLAISRKNDNTIHLGPKVTDANFDQVFGHELVHIIAFQKYKQAIPTWLEEGLANYLAKAGQVNYKWLASHPFPADVRELTHPFNGSEDHVRYHYMASQALAEMLNTKCDFRNLLRLSVGMKMEPYIVSFCQIPDLNVAFKKWVTDHAH